MDSNVAGWRPFPALGKEISAQLSQRAEALAEPRESAKLFEGRGIHSYAQKQPKKK